MKSVNQTVAWTGRRRRDLWIAGCVALVGWSAYNLGLIRSKHDAKPLQEAAVFRIRESAVISVSPAEQGTQIPRYTDTRVVVSRTSTSKKYHFTWCPSASKIKEANKLWFQTAQDAQDAGYTLAANCHP